MTTETQPKTDSEKLQRYAVKQLKLLAQEISEKPNDPNLAASWAIRKEIYTELLHESRHN